MVNKVILVGNVGQKPTSREVNGKTVANCTLATSMKSKGESDLVLQYVDKGSKIYVEGRLTYRKFTNKDGVEQHSTDIVVSDVKFLGDSPKKAGHDDAVFTPPARGGNAPTSDSSEFPF